MEGTRNLKRLRGLLDASGAGEVLYERDARDSVVPNRQCILAHAVLVLLLSVVASVRIYRRILALTCDGAYCRERMHSRMLDILLRSHALFGALFAACQAVEPDCVCLVHDRACMCECKRTRSCTHTQAFVCRLGRDWAGTDALRLCQSKNAVCAGVFYGVCPTLL